MLMMIKSFIGEVLNWKNIVWHDKADFRIPITKKALYAIRGFSANEYVWYQFDKNDYHSYISEYERLKSRAINGAYRFILDDKLIFEEVFSKYTRVPVNYAWVNDGTVYGLHDLKLSMDNILSFLKTNERFILKWNGRGGGHGTYVISFNESHYIVNSITRSEEEVLQLFDRKGSAILCEYIEQSDFAANLYPYATNTIRIVCAKKKDETRAKVIGAVQRFGCDASRPVDNFSSGGFAAEIDLNTGKLSEAYTIHGEKKNQLVPMETHPDTGAQIKGRVIPGWQNVVEDIERITNNFPYLRFVAWDVLLTKDGFCVIEGNASSSCDLFQMHHGIRNSEFGDIYRSYGIID